MCAEGPLVRDRSEGGRRGVAAVWTAASLATLLGFAAIALDTGRLYVVKSELQGAADAAAMGATAELGTAAAEQNHTSVYLAAERYAGLNAVRGQGPVPESVTTELGQAALSTGAGKYAFETNVTPYNAVRVTIRLEGDQAVPMLFAPVFGSPDLSRCPVSARAAAMLIPRDIALVADTSASHNDDSELKRYQDTGVNLEGVWRQLPGGNPETGEGPLWGYLSDIGWGESDLGWDEESQTWSPVYHPAEDPGLVRLKKNRAWNHAWVQGMLAGDSYTADEINHIMSADYDSDSNYGAAWPYRVAVALGWAQWRSGLTDAYGNPQGRYATLGQEPGNGNARVDSSELIWTPFPGYPEDEQSQSWRRDHWCHYVRSYMDQNNEMTSANSAFKYRFGAKTLTNYLLEKRPLSSQSPHLALVPTQPMQAVKDAVRVLTGVVEELQGDDKLSLEYYDRWGHHRENLTYNYAVVADSLDDMQAGQDGHYTNMGGGIQQAIAELTGSRARCHAVKIMVLLTDGRANVNESGGYTDYVGGPEWALDSADQAVAQGIRIYCVSVGSAADRDLMQQIAGKGSGTEFYAAGSIENYSAQLRQIFETLGGTRPVVLIE